MLNFVNKPMRIAAFQAGLGKENGFKIPKFLQENGYNVEQLCHLLQDEKVTEIYGHKKHRELLSKYAADCKERNINLIVYFNAHCVEKEQIDENPEWAQRLPNGDRSLAYGDLVFTCVNSPWKKFFINGICECLEHDVGGVFLDGPIFSDSGCTCNECRRLFLAEYGHEITEGTFREQVEFRTKSVANFVKDVREAMNTVKPEAIVYCNNVGLWQNITGCDMDALFDYVDILATEGGFMFYYDPNRTSLWKCSQSANYLESKSRGIKPYVIFAAGNTCSWNRSMHTPSETRLLFASAVAHGANLWYGIHGPFEMLHTDGGAAAIEFNKLLSKNEQYYTDTKRYTKTAIFWSKNTIDTFPEDSEKTDFTNAITRDFVSDHGSFQNEFKGIYDVLVRNHMAPAIIDEYCMDNISDYSLVILPNISCMSSDTADRIRAYVQNGGKLISTMATSFYSEIGTPYEKPVLSDVLGIDSLKDFYTTEKLGCVYLDVSDSLSSQLKVPNIMAGFDKCYKIEYSKDSNVLMDMYTPMGGNYSPMSRIKYPAIIERQYGKGSVIYIAGNIGDSIYRFGLQDMKNLLNIFINKYAQKVFEVENAFESMEITLREQHDTGRILMHFVNFTGQMTRPVNKIIPCRDIRVTVKNVRDIETVMAVVADKNLSFSINENDLIFSIPEVYEYELITIERNATR